MHKLIGATAEWAWGWSHYSSVAQWVLKMFHTLVVNLSSDDTYWKCNDSHRQTVHKKCFCLVWFNVVMCDFMRSYLQTICWEVASSSLKAWRLVKIISLCKTSTLIGSQPKLVLTRTELPHTDTHPPHPHEMQKVFSLEALLHCITRFTGLQSREPSGLISPFRLSRET